MFWMSVSSRPLCATVYPERRLQGIYRAPETSLRENPCEADDHRAIRRRYGAPRALCLTGPDHAYSHPRASHGQERLTPQVPAQGPGREIHRLAAWPRRCGMRERALLAN